MSIKIQIDDKDFDFVSQLLKRLSVDFKVIYSTKKEKEIEVFFKKIGLSAPSETEPEKQITDTYKTKPKRFAKKRG